MILFKTIRSRHFSHKLFKPQIPSNDLTPLISTNSSEYSFISSIYCKPFSLSAQFVEKPEEKSQITKKPLSVFFKEAVGLSERTESNGDELETEGEGENAILKKKLRTLEEEVRILNNKRREKEGETQTPKSPPKKGKLIERKADKRSLSALFSDKKVEEVKLVDPTDFGNEDPTVHKELSDDMQMFAHHLYMEGYFKDASFMPKNKFDVTRFEVSYAREFLKFAAVRFGKDHQEIGKWLSASDLKKIALFGCPSLGQRSVYSAKHMRKFFEIEEHKVCKKCRLKDSCKHANLTPRKIPTQLHLGSVTRVLSMYALDSVPQQLVVPEEIKDSVSRLINELVKLSQTVS